MRYLRRQKRKNLILTINFVLFLIMVFFKAYGDAMLANNRSLGDLDNIKYIFLLIASLLNFSQLNKNGVIRNDFVKELKFFVALLSIWFVISLVGAINVTTSMNRAIIYWVSIILPFVYAYCAINVVDLEMIERFFKAGLIICFGCYLLFEVGFQMFSASNLAIISFLNSSSPFESSYSAGSSIGMCAYFGYNRKGNLPWLLMSMLFCFFTFKRMSVIMMFIYFFIPIICNKDKVLKQIWVIIPGVIIAITTIVETYAFHPDNYAKFNQWFINMFAVDTDKFFMGRVRLYSILANSGYRTAGLGTTLDKMYYLTGKVNGIELELAQLLIEVTIVGVIAFLIYCYKLTRRNLYCLVIMAFVLFNMLTSSSLGNSFSWVFTYLTIWSIHKRNLQMKRQGVCNEKIHNNNSSL